MSGAMPTALRGHGFGRNMPTQSRGHGTPHEAAARYFASGSGHSPVSYQIS
jgi:hypothetical protein